MRRFTLGSIGALLLSLLSAAQASAQTCTPSIDERPLWIQETPRGYAFDYFVGQGEDAQSVVAAKGAATGNAISAIVAKGLITVSTDTRSKQTETSVNDEAKLVSEISEEVRVQGHSTTVKGLEQVELHLEQCGSVQRAFALVRVPKKNPEEPPSAFAPVWRSIVAPGWGQFYKRQPVKGALILSGEVVTLAAGITTYILSSNDAADAAAATTQANRDFFLQRRDVLFTASLVSFGVAAALYIYNIIDAAAAPQANVYALTPLDSRDWRFAFAPIFAP